MRIIINLKVNPPHTIVSAKKDYSGKDKVSERNLGDALFEILQETFQGLQSESNGRMKGEFKKVSDVKTFLVNASERYSLDIAKDALKASIDFLNGDDIDKETLLKQLQKAFDIVSL